MKISPVQKGSRSSSTIPCVNRSAWLNACWPLVILFCVSATPPLPKSVVRQKPVLHGGTTLMRLAQTKALPKPSPDKPFNGILSPFYLPKGATNEWWDVQWSTDMKVWKILTRRVRYQNPISNVPVFISETITQTNAVRFYRLHATTNL